MATNDIRGLRVAILAGDGVEEAELVEPRKALEDAGAKTTLISQKPGKIQAMNHDEKSNTYKVDDTLENAKAEDFDAVTAARWRIKCRRAQSRRGRATVRPGYGRI